MSTSITEVPAADTNSALAHFGSKPRFETDCWDVNEAQQHAEADFVLLDVRAPEAFARGHVEGAVNPPHRQITPEAQTSYPKETLFVRARYGARDGRRVTTHWRYAEQLARQYPEITVDPRALYVDGRGRIAKLMEQVRSRPGAAYSVAELARRVSMSPRTLQRKFRETVGMPPQEWVLRARIGIAKDLLEDGAESLQSIAGRVGFGSQETFRRHFRRVVGTSPSAYRRLFTEQGAPSVSCRDRRGS